MLGKPVEIPARETGGFLRVVAPLLPLHYPFRIMLNRWYHIPIVINQYQQPLENDKERKQTCTIISVLPATTTITTSVALCDPITRLFILYYFILCSWLADESHSFLLSEFSDLEAFWGDDVFDVRKKFSEHRLSSMGEIQIRILAGQDGRHLRSEDATGVCSHGGVWSPFADIILITDLSLPYKQKHKVWCFSLLTTFKSGVLFHWFSLNLFFTEFQRNFRVSDTNSVQFSRLVLKVYSKNYFFVKHVSPNWLTKNHWQSIDTILYSLGVTWYLFHHFGTKIKIKYKAVITESKYKTINSRSKKA